MVDLNKSTVELFIRRGQCSWVANIFPIRGTNLPWMGKILYKDMFVLTKSTPSTTLNLFQNLILI